MRRAAAVIASFALSGTPASAAIRGRVVSSEGTPVSGAAVSAYAPESADQEAVRRLAGVPRAPLKSTVTDRDGAFQLDLSHPLVIVEARAEGFAPAFAGAARADPPLTLQARPARPVRPYVMGERERPVEGAVVVWTASDSTGASAEVIARTTADGSYQVPDPGAWADAGYVLHPDFAPLAMTTRISEIHPHRLDAGEPIEGRVVDAGGQPLGGATVWVGRGRPWPAARTGEDGAFRIAHAPRQWRTLSARHQKLVGTVTRPSGPITIVAGPGRSLAGQVTDTKGRRLAGARVAVFADIPWRLSSVTDDDGRYQVDGLPPARYVARAFRPGFVVEGIRSHGEQETDLTTDLTASRDFALRPLITARGRVVDERGRPVPGARVAFAGEGPAVYVPEVYRSDHGPAWTAADGTFVARAAPLPKDVEDRLGRRQVVVLKPGFAVARVADEALRSGGAVTVRLKRGVELAGRVTTEQGLPLAGVRVTLVEAGTLPGGLSPSQNAIARAESEGWVVSDEAGRFSVRVQPVDHHVRLQKPGHAPLLVESHDPRAGRALDVVLRTGARVAGRVTRPGGKGVRGVAVVLTHDAGDLARTTTRDDGGFDFDDLAPGTYRVRVHDNERGFARTELAVVPGPDLEIEFAAPGILRGRVVDAQTREPVTSFWTAIEWPRGEKTADGNREKDVRHPDGVFTWAEVPAGEVSVMVAADGYVGREVKLVLATDRPTAELEVALERAVQVRGRVTSDGTTGIPRAAVLAHTPAGRRVSMAYTDGQGAYELPGVRPGELWLRVYAEGFVPGVQTVDARAAAVADITLERGLTIEGIVLQGDAPVENAGVTVDAPGREGRPPSARTDASGHFRLSGFVAGRHRVEAGPPRRGTRVSVEVDLPSPPLRLVLPVLHTATLRGRVTGLQPGDVEAVVLDARNAHGEGASVSVGPDMTFVLEDAPVGHVTLFGRANTGTGGRVARTQAVDLAPGQVSELTVVFTDDLLSGTVTRRGTPVPDVYVSFNSDRVRHASGRTDAAGRYRVLGLESGQYTVQVSSGADALLTEERAIASPGTLDLDLGNPSAPR